MRIDLDALFAASPSPYVLLDPDLRMVWANDAYIKVTGRERDTLIGRLMTEEFPAPPDSVSDQMLRASFRRVLATGQTDHLPLIPYPIETVDGKIEERVWSATHTPILNADGQVEFILQNTMDVTGLYRGEAGAITDDLPQRAAMVQRAEAVATENLALGTMMGFFQSAFDQAPSFIAILNGQQHIFQITNQSYTDLIGGRDVIGLPVREALPELAQQGYFELLDQVYASGEAVSMKGMSALIQPTPDGQLEQRFVDFFAHPLKDDTGASIGVFVQGHDVTGQGIAEATLTATREKFRTMAQTMPNQVWTADQDGGLTWLNDRTYNFTGYREGELYGGNWERVVHPDDLEATVEKWADAIAQGITYEHEFRIRKADGSFRWHLVRASPLRADNGLLTGWVGTNTDIEDRKNTEAQIAQLNATLETRVAKRNQDLQELHETLRQSQKMEAIGGLAGGIAHDFNNLLQVITGNLQLAAREIPQDSPGQVRIDQAMKSVMRGATLASQLLSFARKQPLAPVVTNLSRLLGDTTEILRSAIGEGVELVTRYEDALWNTNVDPNNMENALLNLAINARDAMDGMGTLSIEIGNADFTEAYAHSHPDVAAGQYVALAVTDTGCGMQPETVARIFEPFFTTKEDGHGTGLGLSMVYGFAKQSGGHVIIESVPGAGTTITIYLPRSFEDVQDMQPAEARELSGGSETILLVEDDDEVRQTTFHMLTDLGYTVLPSSDAKHALSIVESGQQLDLLFTDVVMPGEVTSHALAEQMHRLRPGVPVLFTSGYVQDSIVHNGRLDEGIQLLSKPYGQSDLAQKIRAVLGGNGVPVLSPNTNTAPLAHHCTQPKTPQFDGLRILVCEDDILIRTDIADGLRDAGCTVLEAGSAQKALDILKSEAVDLLVTDVGLPDRTGEELAQDARNLIPDLPVIFATGGINVPSAAVLGNCKVLGKPFRDVDLQDAIGTMVFSLREQA